MHCMQSIPEGSSPRMRGTLRADDHGQRILGIIPRMRGTRHAYDRSNSYPGIIPAYAGNTGVESARISGWGDHPRVCGEHHGHATLMTMAIGSSPRMRGTPGGSVAFAALGRDHPRVCGEHFQDFTAPTSSGGSSPRMRGTRHRVGHGHGRHGIIPAYAGNTPIRI